MNKALAILSILALAAVPAVGANRYWGGGAGDGLWATGENWTNDEVPGETEDDYTRIQQAGAVVEIDQDIDALTPNNITTFLMLNSPTLNVTAGKFANTGGCLIYSGEVNQSAGEFDVGGSVLLGNAAADLARFTVSGASTTFSGLNGGYAQFTVGASATGTTDGGGVITQYGGEFIQNDGDVNLDLRLEIGKNLGATGKYELNGGTFTHDQFNGICAIGGAQFDGGAPDDANGYGVFRQTGTSVSNWNYTVSVGANVGSTGMYEMVGGTANFNSNLYVGSSSTGDVAGTGTYGGTFVQDGGDVFVGPASEQRLYIGSGAGSTGKYVMNDGTLTGHGPSWAADLVVGEAGTGVFEQNGGVVDMTHNGIKLGRSSGVGTYELNGGTLRAKFIQPVSAGSSFVMTGGRLEAGSVAAALVNGGGTIAPGLSTGLTYCNVSFTATSADAELEIEMAGTTQAASASDPGTYDFFTVYGTGRTAALNGILSVKLIDGFESTIQDTDTFDVLFASGGITGTFTNLDGDSRVDEANGLGSFLVTVGGTTVTLSDWVPAPADLPGDTDGDGDVDINDLSTLAANWDQCGKAWADGDFTGDGCVDINDLSLLASNWGTTPVAQVPEPATLSVLALGGLALLRRRRA